MTALAALALGRYGCVDPGHDNDAWEHGAYHLELRADGERIAFAYSYESRSNHGYNLAGARGFVVAETANEIVVELLERTSSGWEDLFKQDQREHSSARERVVLEVVDAATVRYSGRLYAKQA